MANAEHIDAHGDHGGHDIGFHAPHVVPAAVFLRVILTLMVLTVITVAVSYIDFGEGNMFVAMATQSRQLARPDAAKSIVDRMEQLLAQP